MLITVFQYLVCNEDFAAVLEGYNYFNDDQDQHDFMFLRCSYNQIILPKLEGVVITQDRIDYLKDQFNTMQEYQPRYGLGRNIMVGFP
jgi:hypothetical protein